LLQGVIALAMAKVVVNVFEIIHVDEDKRAAQCLARS
jgi:hypothetical protein